MIKNQKESYNQFTNLPEISYNCIAYLMQHDNMVWRLLGNSNADCLDESKYPDFTQPQKASLVYTGGDNITDCRVFLDIGMDDAWKEEASVLRVSPAIVTPDTYVYGKVHMLFEVYTHFQINHLSNNAARTTTIIQRLISVYNGAEIPGLGRLFFDKRASPLCKVVATGRIPFKGMGLMMCNFLLG